MKPFPTTSWEVEMLEEVAVEVNQDLHVERADRIAVTTSILCAFVVLLGWWFISVMWIHYFISPYYLGVHSMYKVL